MTRVEKLMLCAAVALFALAAVFAFDLYNPSASSTQKPKPEVTVTRQAPLPALDGPPAGC